MNIFKIFKKNNHSLISRDETKENIVNKTTNINHDSISNFDFLKGMEKKNLHDLTESQYEKLYEKFDDLLCDYDEISSDIRFIFEEDFNYITRVRILKKAINKFNQIVELAGPYWFEDYWFSEEMIDTCKIDAKNSEKWKVNIDLSLTNEGDFVPEFAQYDFSNIYFIKYILDIYQNSPLEIKKHLKEEEYRYNCAANGGEREYLKLLQEEQEWREFKNEVFKIVMERRELYQKDISNYITNTKFSNRIPKAVKQLSEEGKVYNEKIGRYIKVYFLD